MRRTLFLAALAVTSAGCGIVTIRTPSDAPTRPAASDRVPETQAEHHAAIERRYFPDTVALLASADKALDAKSYDDALTAARKAKDTLAKEYDATSKDVAAREADDRVWLQARMLEGLALRGLGKDLDAALAISSWPFSASSCRIDLRDRCRDYAEWLTKSFPSLFGDAYSLSLRRATSVPFAGDLSVLDMDVSEREILAKKGYVGVVIEPTSRKNVKDGVALRVEGRTTTGSYEDCNKVATIKVEDTKYDVKRCHDVGYTARRADFVATISAEDAAKLTGAKGEQVFLVFDVKGWKKTGNVYTCGTARVAYVIPPKSN